MNDKVKAALDILGIEVHEVFNLRIVDIDDGHIDDYKIDESCYIWRRRYNVWELSNIDIGDIFNGSFEIIKIPKLTEEQKEKLKALLVLGFEWLARDGDGEFGAYISKPKKSGSGLLLMWTSIIGLDLNLREMGIDFDFVKAKDTEPTNIRELLGE